MNFYAKSKRHILKPNEKETVEKAYSDLIEEMGDILSKAEIAALENEKNSIINAVYEEQKTLREHLDETVKCAEEFFEQYGKYFVEKEKILFILRAGIMMLERQIWFFRQIYLMMPIKSIKI